MFFFLLSLNWAGYHKNCFVSWVPFFTPERVIRDFSQVQSSGLINCFAIMQTRFRIWPRVTFEPQANGAKRLTSVNQYDLKRLSNIAWKRNLFLRLLFHTYENIASNRKKGTFFVLLIGTFLNRKKGTFFALLKSSLQTEKRYLFRALKFCLVKWEMDEKRTILTLKYFHPKA